MKLGEVCTHGSLKRQCRTCELDEILVDNSKVNALMVEQLRAADELAKTTKALGEEIVKLRGDSLLDGLLFQASEALAAYEKARNGD